MSVQQAKKMQTPRAMVLPALMAIGGIVAVTRLFGGLGAVTNLSDFYPWGFWLAFDVLGGVAMAAGGFVIACAVYLFNWKKYKAIGRPAILTAFLGYLMAVIALFFDIGQPWRLWHPMFMWQLHSVMWVVAIHVVLYTTTLGIESSPMLMERLRFEKAGAFIKKIYIPAVIFGVMLSTLHQSSLGAVFLIAPSRLSPLWFSKFLPYMFLVSAVAMGISMVSVETMLSEKAFGHKVSPEILSGLAKGLRNSLALYLLLKIFFLFRNVGAGEIFDGSLAGNMFIVEMLTGVMLPLGLLFNPAVVARRRGLLGIHCMVIVGVLVNRLNVCIFGMQNFTAARGATYFPSLTEFLLSMGIVALGVFLYRLAAKHLPLFAEAA